MQKDLTSNPHLRKRMSYIDALRGLACLWVLINHSVGYRKPDSGWFYYPFRFLVYIADTGWLGVSLFLVLSGFCLTYPLALKYKISDVQLDKKEFFQRRLRRILPPYYAALLISLALPYAKYLIQNGSLNGVEESLPWITLPFDVFSHIFMIHNLFAATFGTINGALWSLALEFQLYLIFPSLLLMARKWGLKSIVFLTATLSVGWQIFAFSQKGLSLVWSPESAALYHALPGRCFEFVLGMLAAYLVARPVANQTRYAVYISALLLLPLTYFVIFVSRFGPGLDPLWGILFACLLVSLNHIPERLFQENKTLRYLTWFGGISYSVYLMHIPLFSVLNLDHFENDVVLVLFAFARIAVVSIIAYGFYLTFEKPFMKKKPVQSIKPVEVIA